MFEPGEEIASFAIWINPMMENLSSLHNKRSVTASMDRCHGKVTHDVSVAEVGVDCYRTSKTSLRKEYCTWDAMEAMCKLGSSSESK